MRRKLVMLLAAGSLLLGLLAGGTMALFSAQAGPTEGDFTAGTLCITADRNAGEAVPGPMFYITTAGGATPDGTPGLYPTGLWAPGDQHKRTLTVTHDPACSTMHAWLASAEATLTDDSYAAMADQLLVTVFAADASGDKVQVGEALLSDFLAAPIDLRYPDGGRIPLLLGGNVQMAFEVAFDLGAGNEFQDKTLIAHFHVNAEQMANNP